MGIGYDREFGELLTYPGVLRPQGKVFNREGFIDERNDVFATTVIYLRESFLNIFLLYAWKGTFRLIKESAFSSSEAIDRLLFISDIKERAASG